LDFFIEKNIQHKDDIELMYLIFNGNYHSADSKIQHMILAAEKQTGEATPEYVNQDR
jgi:hypothetical protein